MDMVTLFWIVNLIYSFNLNGRFIYFMNILPHIMQSTVQGQLKYNPVSRLGLCAMMNAFVKQTV